jgi:dinuclear metal center YbgI/SA1388 family protein
MRNTELEKILNQTLDVASFQDYAPNGLQVEGRPDVRKIITGVTASQALVDQAVAQQADAIIVHHGYFWKNDASSVRGMLRQRLKALLSNDINLYAYHLPLDAHPTLGNNAQLGELLGITLCGEMDRISLHGEFDTPLTASDLQHRLEHRLQRSVLHCGDHAPATIRRIAWCTGGGQSYIDQAADRGMDAFISGEVSEKTIHTARERGIHFFAAGHHATERYGVKALGEWLNAKHGLDVTFIDIDNPA